MQTASGSGSSDAQILAALQSFSQQASGIVTLIGTISFLGWVLNLDVLKTILPLPGLVTMKTNTALGFIFGGLALRLLYSKPSPRVHLATQLCALVPLLIGGLTLVQYATGLNLGIDELLFKEAIGAVGTGAPNRVSPNSSFNFLVLGGVLLLLTGRRIRIRLVQGLTLLALLIALLGLLGYLYQLKKLYGIGSYTQMALHAAIGFILLCFGILFRHPERGMMQVVTSHHAGGIMARRLFPALLFIPPTLGWLVFLGVKSQIYPVEISLSLLVVLNIIVFASVTWVNAKFLGIVDLQRQRAEEQSRIDAAAAAQAEALKQTLQKLQQTQAQLIQSEKMSSLGQLVAGVAHEINNPVNFIYGNLSHANQYIQDLLQLVQLYQEQIPKPPAKIQAWQAAIDLTFLQEDLPKLLASMRVGTDRIRQIVLSLRTFSRLDEAEMKPVDVHEGIDSTLLILQHRLKPRTGYAGIEVVKHYGRLPLVECYAGQLNQVLMNLLSNAIDAIESQPDQSHKRTETDQPGQITIVTEVVNADWIRVRIHDTGVGMPESVQRRIFDPFFTTKPVGQGTGLGLSISYQIVAEKHHGVLECHSEPGQGTEFVIRLPIAQSQWSGWALTQ